MKRKLAIALLVLTVPVWYLPCALWFCVAYLYDEQFRPWLDREEPRS